MFEGIDFYSNISRALFENMCADLFSGTLDPVEKALEDASMQKTDINEVVLVIFMLKLKLCGLQLRETELGHALKCTVGTAK